ncbi:MAG: class I SAM-dependent methyltransferase [Anaerolineae bacterium]|nr:class I SAM-dependent methyltransferase [Anaerolineae bacterium]
MSTNFKQIYATQAANYDAMVSCEDYQGNLWTALRQIRDFAGLMAVDVGAGTGRMTRLLAPHVERITAVDISPHMLQQANLRLTAVADACHLPFKSSSADVAIAGWALGHSVGWYPDSWQTVIGQAIASMRRVLRPTGSLIVIETMGTGTETAVPPHAGLAAYYHWLENDLGFHHTTIATDYQFSSVTQAIALTQFFFGDALAEKIQQQQLTILPEFTGIWWQTKSVDS